MKLLFMDMFNIIRVGDLKVNIKFCICEFRKVFLGFFRGDIRQRVGYVNFQVKGEVRIREKNLGVIIIYMIFNNYQM